MYLASESIGNLYNIVLYCVEWSAQWKSAVWAGNLRDKNKCGCNVGSIVCLRLHQGITSVLQGADAVLINYSTGMR